MIATIADRLSIGQKFVCCRKMCQGLTPAFITLLVCHCWLAAKRRSEICATLNYIGDIFFIFFQYIVLLQ